MGHACNKYLLRICLGVVSVILAGCGPDVQKPLEICAGLQTATQALSVLRSRAEHTIPLRANGHCLLQYYAQGSRHKENFPVKLWVNPPAELYLQGDVAFNARGIVLGSNETEFWLWIKPKEVSSYWWGQWFAGDYPEKLMISPRTLLEGLGIVGAAGQERDAGRWQFGKDGPFDVLTRFNNEGLITKKVYMYSCDQTVRKIEYFNETGEPAVVAELGRYKEVVEGFSVPHSVKITQQDKAGAKDSARIRLGSVKPTQIVDRLRQSIFVRPEPRGFKHIYRVVGDEIIEQPQ